MASGTRIRTKSLGADELPGEASGRQKRPELAQFRLQVDRQTKASYATHEDAEQAGLAIKRKYPLVQVAVYDAVAGTNKLLELAVAQS